MITCVMVSNYFNRHQLPFSLAMERRLDYTFLETEGFNAQRLKVGYTDLSGQYPFVRKADTAEKREKALRSIGEADVVIAGGPDPLVYQRILSGRLTFVCTERVLKRGLLRYFSPRLQKFYRESYYRFSGRNNFHLLASGAYCPFDMRLAGIPKDRIWKWGYFPVLAEKDDIVKSNPVPLILWAGRMIGWKHPETILYAADRLRKDRRFRVRLIGSGEKKPMLEEIVKQRGLGDIVELKPSVPQEHIFDEMKQADIYVLPSNQEEGWGAVINEAMSSGCCVVASREAGAVPWLIRNGETGFTFHSGDAAGLARVLDRALSDGELRGRVASRGRENIYRNWTGEIAAERLIRLSGYLLGEASDPRFESGPCSPAEIIAPPFVLL